MQWTRILQREEWIESSMQESKGILIILPGESVGNEETVGNENC